MIDPTTPAEARPVPPSQMELLVAVLAELEVDDVLGVAVITGGEDKGLALAVQSGPAGFSLDREDLTNLFVHGFVGPDMLEGP